MLGYCGWGKIDELANLPERCDAIFQEIFQDHNACRVGLGFMPEGLDVFSFGE
jgi:hypothetical protein